MPRFRAGLPQAPNRPFLTDGGIETTLIFHYGLELPCFASFPLLESESGRRALRQYYASYATVARRLGLGFLLESPTWRANPDWGAKLNYSGDRLTAANRSAIALLEELRAALDLEGVTTVIAGNLGPRGDGYVPSSVMTASEAESYHRPQIEAFAATEADLVSALTLNYPDEAVGIARAAEAAGMPVVLSFTVETDGRLPTGEPLQQAIEATDQATDGYPSYYMINCAHPTHLLAEGSGQGGWRRRVGGVRANASPRSHAELNEATTLDEGDPIAFGALHRQLASQFTEMCVIGGCCGTDHRHVEQAWLAVRG